MNKFFKKLALVLSFAMVFTAMPMSVFAATTMPTPDSNGLIKLTENVVLDNTYYVDGDVTIDLAGYSISNDGGTFTHLICVDAGESLTIMDSVGGGSIVRKNTGGSYATVISNEQGTVTVEGGTIEIDGTTSIMCAIDVLTNQDGDSGNATLYINGGTIKSARYAVRTFGNAWPNSSDTCIVEFNNGTVEGRDGFFVHHASNNSAIELNVNNGKVIASRYAFNIWDSTAASDMEQVSVNVNNGEISGDIGIDVAANADVNLEINGGKFETAPPAEYIASGKVFDPATGVVGDPAPVATQASTTCAHVWGYNTQYDAAAHWDHCYVCGAQNTPVAHSDADGNGVCDCGWNFAATTNRANPNTGVTAEMLK